MVSDVCLGAWELLAFCRERLGLLSYVLESPPHRPHPHPHTHPHAHTRTHTHTHTHTQPLTRWRHYEVTLGYTHAYTHTHTHTPYGHSALIHMNNPYPPIWAYVVGLCERYVLECLGVVSDVLECLSDWTWLVLWREPLGVLSYVRAYVRAWAW